ncbi:MAG: DUF3800 domain-containing protein [Acidimicrobiales bacterium]
MMHVDESGDCGMVRSPSRYFVLTGLVVHEVRWVDCLNALIDFRRRMRDAFGLKIREELHAAIFISRPGPLARISKDKRLTIIRAFADQLASMTDLSLINVVVDKNNKSPDFDVFDVAWNRLLQRFENTIKFKNFPGPRYANEQGVLYPDHTDNKRLTQLLRKMRRHNYVPYRGGGAGPTSRNLIVAKVIEDPSFRESSSSLFVQATDLAAFLLYQHLTPNAYMRRKGGRNYFARLHPILCKVASRDDPQGIVRI